MANIVIDGIEIAVTKKRIKNLYIRIIPPFGNVFISAPMRMSHAEILKFAESKVDWIKIHQKRFALCKPEEVPLYQTGDRVYLWGEPFVLRVADGVKNVVQVQDGVLLLILRPGSTLEQRKKVLYSWYRKQLLEQIPLYASKWQNTIGVKASQWIVRDMKTRWGSCNVKTKKICINLRLIHKAPKLLEYIIVHELVHLLEKSHNTIFRGYMDGFLPDWRMLKKELNCSPM